MENSATVVSLRHFFAGCGSRSWKAKTELEITVSEPITFTALRAFQSEDVYATFPESAAQLAFDQGREGSIPAGTSLVLQVPRQVQRLVVAAGVADLLSVPGAQVQEPSAYILVGSREKGEPFAHLRGETLESAPDEVRRYHEAIKLWTILSGQAEHVESSSGALLFFGVRRTEICPGFDEADLPETSAVGEILAFVENPDRKTTRAEIFSAALSEFLRDQSKEASFRALLRDTPRFARRLKEGLAIYLAEHSPEKLAADARSTALTISEKLEKIIGGLETKSLSIPAALLLAVKDVEPGLGFTSMNFIIFASAATYGVTMTLVHRSQSALLDVIRETIGSAVDELAKKGLDKNNPVIAKTYAGMAHRCSSALTGSRVMLTGSWIPLLFVLGTAFFGTPKKIADAIPAPQAATPAAVAPKHEVVPLSSPPAPSTISVPGLRKTETSEDKP